MFLQNIRLSLNYVALQQRKPHSSITILLDMMIMFDSCLSSSYSLQVLLLVSHINPDEGSTRILKTNSIK
jgi:hypothetical protein